MGVLEWILTVFVLAGGLPLVAGCYQFALAGLHRFRRRSVGVLEHEPNVAVLVPAWNEAFVIGRTIDTLVALDYPEDRLRVYVVDDASTDETPDVVLAKAAEHPGRVFHLRRAKGGEGKAHTLNHGLRQIRAEGWYDAVLVIDADVIFTFRSLRRMVRHLADPSVGAVTGYIKEGSRPANFMNRFISFEYIAAQAGARRAQNVLGAQACLAGGAQLLRREALEAIGGEIDTSSLAEDTFTTFNVQLAGPPRGVRAARDRVGRGAARHRRAVEAAGALGPRQRPGHAALPARLAAPQQLRAPRWHQLRADLVLRLPHARADGALVRLAGHALRARPRALDRRLQLAVGAEPRDLLVRDALGLRAGRPGGTAQLAGGDHVPGPDQPRDHRLRRPPIRCSTRCRTGCCCSPTCGCPPRCSPPISCGGSRPSPYAGRLAPLLLYVVGYGPLLCAITAAAYVSELRRAEMAWEKTEKTGAVGDMA